MWHDDVAAVATLIRKLCIGDDAFHLYLLDHFLRMNARMSRDSNNLIGDQHSQDLKDLLVCFIGLKKEIEKFT